MIVKDEAENLTISLPAVVDIADEIIILDSGSTDDSQIIAEQYGAKWFVNTDWQGFGKQRQLAQNHAKGDWILALDADEEVSAELKESILNVIATKPADTVFGLKRIDCLFQHKINHHCWTTKAHWRLYPKKYQFHDNEVHESLNMGVAQTKVLSGWLLHHSVPTPLFWLNKRLAYAYTWAKERHLQTKKISPFRLIGSSLCAFIKHYLAYGGFLQGRYGLLYSVLFSQYAFNKYALLYDMSEQPNSYATDYQPHTITYKNLPNIVKKETWPKKSSLSVVMIVKNEQKHLAACLNNITDIADEIIILDSGSTDQTQTIAEHYGAKWFVNTDWQGFGKQRQFAQSYAKGDYIFAIDADEQIDATLKQSIIDLCQRPVIEDHVYLVKRLDLFCKRRLAYSWYHVKFARIYARKRYQFSDLTVHESLHCNKNEAKTLKGTLLHYTNDNLHHFLNKNIQYSHTWALERYHHNKKITILGIFIKTFVSFLREYIIRGTFLGGTYGFIRAYAGAFYTFNKYTMLWVKHKQKSIFTK